MINKPMIRNYKTDHKKVMSYLAKGWELNKDTYHADVSLSPIEAKFSLVNLYDVKTRFIIHLAISTHFLCARAFVPSNSLQTCHSRIFS